MDYEYPTSLGYQIFYGILAALSLVAGFVIFSSIGSKDTGAALVFSAIFLAIGALIFINLFKRKVTITDSVIKYAWVFKTTEIPFTEVKGYRIYDKAVIIESTDPTRKKMRIGDYLTLSDGDGLKEWIKANFNDINKQEYDAEKQEILDDSTLGATKDEREKLFARMRKLNMYYSMPGILSFAVIAILHRSSQLVSGVLLIYPLIGIILMRYSRGLIILFAKKSSAYLSIGIGMLFPVIALIVESSFDVKVLSYDNLWVPAGIISAIVLCALSFLSLRKHHPVLVAQFIFALIISLGYGFGSALQVNSVFDQSEPKIYNAIISDKHVTHGKNTSYHLILGSWGAYGGENMSVSQSYYDRVQVGDSLQVYQKKGTLNVPWFYIKE